MRAAGSSGPVGFHETCGAIGSASRLRASSARCTMAWARGDKCRPLHQA